MSFSRIIQFIPVNNDIDLSLNNKLSSFESIKVLIYPIFAIMQK